MLKFKPQFRRGKLGKGLRESCFQSNSRPRFGLHRTGSRRSPSLRSSGRSASSPRSTVRRKIPSISRTPPRVRCAAPENFYLLITSQRFEKFQFAASSHNKVINNCALDQWSAGSWCWQTMSSFQSLRGPQF